MNFSMIMIFLSTTSIVNVLTTKGDRNTYRPLYPDWVLVHNTVFGSDINRVTTVFEDIKKTYEPQIFSLMHDGLSYNEAVERLYDELGYSGTYPLEKETA